MNFFELFVTLAMNLAAYRKGLKEAENEANSSGSKIKGFLSGIGGALGKGIGVTAKALVAGLTAAGTAVGVLAKKSVEAYANYEQLVGGVETLFGEISKTTDASAEVIRRAGNAFKTAGLSANKYMETVTSFSASQ